MIYLADTADIAEIKELFEYLPMEGVTTNPTIIKYSVNLCQSIPEIQSVIGDKMLHIQVISQRRRYFERSETLSRFSEENYYVKIPVTRKAIRLLLW